METVSKTIYKDIKSAINNNYFDERLLFKTDFLLANGSGLQRDKLSGGKDSQYIYGSLSESAIITWKNELLETLQETSKTILLGIGSGTVVKEKILHDSGVDGMYLLPTDLSTEVVSSVKGDKVLESMQLDFTSKQSLESIKEIIAAYKYRAVSLFNIFGNRDVAKIAIHLSKLGLKKSDILFYDVCSIPPLQGLSKNQKNDIFEYHISLNDDPNELLFIGQPLSILSGKTVQELYDGECIDMEVKFNQELMRIERYLSIKKSIKISIGEEIPKGKRILCGYSKKYEPKKRKKYLEKSFRKKHKYFKTKRDPSFPIGSSVGVLSF